jgi:hypothetical protein
MAYKSIARRPVREMREPVPGNGRVMIPGKSHSVTIIGADKDTLADHIVVRFQDAFEEIHREQIFLLGQSKTDLSFMMKALITATCTDTLSVRAIYDTSIDGDFDWLASIVGKPVLIETEYRDTFINLKSIRSTHDRNNSGSFFQPTETNKPHPAKTVGVGNSPQYAATPDAASAFFGPRS